MAFDWMCSRVPDTWRARWPQRALDSQRQEVRERAALLLRLGRSREEAVARCRQNLRWDYELHGAPETLDEVDDLVHEVYRRTLSLDPQSDATTRG